MSRNIEEAAERVLYDSDEMLVEIAQRDPSMFRDIAAAFLSQPKPSADLLAAAKAGLREIQRMAADGIEATAEGSDTWNLFADIHQRAALELQIKGEPVNEANG